VRAGGGVGISRDKVLRVEGEFDGGGEGMGGVGGVGETAMCTHFYIKFYKPVCHDSPILYIRLL
jgi:hypothetical protein